MATTNNNDDWAQAPLKSLVDYRKGKKASGLTEENTFGSQPYIDIEAFEKGNIRRYTSDKSAPISTENDILVVWDGARCGLAGKAKGAIGSTLMRLTPKNLNSDYLLLFLQSKYTEINTRPRGTGIPHVNPEFFWEIEVPIPNSEVQAVIVKKSKLFATPIIGSIAKINKSKMLVQKFRQSVLSAAVTGKLTKEWREKNPEIETASKLLEKIVDENKISKSKLKPLNIDNLQELPDKWIWCRFEQIGELARGKSKHRPRNDSKLFGGKYPFIQTGDVARSTGLVTNYSQTYNDVGLAQSRLFPKGTLCITIAANIADAGILGIDACFPDSVVGFIPCKPLLVDYFYYFINIAKNDLEQFAPETAQKNINLGILNELAIPLPPLEEQKEIVKRVNYFLDLTKDIGEQIKKTEGKVDKLTQSILAKAFRGEL